MAFDFPSNPALMEEFIATPNMSYIWKGERWDRGHGVPPPIAPVLRALTPDSVFLNTPVTVTIEGDNFTPDTKILCDGLYKPTTYIDDRTITIEAPVSAVAKQVKVVARNDIFESNELIFIYEIKIPAVWSLVPDSGNSIYAANVSVTGGNFEPQTEIMWDTTIPMPTTYISETELTFFLDVAGMQMGAHAVSARTGMVMSTTNDSFEIYP